MTKRQLPPEIRADNLAIRATNFAYRHARYCDQKRNNGTGNVVNPTEANRIARLAAKHLRDAVDIFGNPSHELRQGLGSLLLLASKHEHYQPDTGPTHDLLAAVYEGLGGAISSLRDGVSIADLEEGMFAAARLARDIDAGDLDGDRQADDRCKVRILTLQLRAAEYRSEIEGRRLRAKWSAKQKPAATQPAFYG